MLTFGLLPCSPCVCARSISVGKQLVNIPSFLVRIDSERHIDFSTTSPLGQGRKGRVARRREAQRAAAASGGGGGDEGEDSDE